MIPSVCIACVLLMIGLAISGLRLTIWAILLISLGIIVTLAGYVGSGHMGLTHAIGLAVLLLGPIQAGYLGGFFALTMIGEGGDEQPATIAHAKPRNGFLRKLGRKKPLIGG